MCNEQAECNVVESMQNLQKLAKGFVNVKIVGVEKTAAGVNQNDNAKPVIRNQTGATIMLITTMKQREVNIRISWSENKKIQKRVHMQHCITIHTINL